MTEPTRLGLIGDAHGNERFLSDAVRALDEVGVARAFQLGDFGLWFSQPSLEAARQDRLVGLLEETCAVFDFHLDVVMGNHDDYGLYEAALAESSDEFAHVSDHIHILPRVYLEEIAGVRIAALAGAASVDFEHRRPARDGVLGRGSWWYQEAIEEHHVAELARLAGDRPIDVLLMHDAPSSPELMGRLRATADYWSLRALEYADVVRHRVDDAVATVHPRLTVSGHYHQHVDNTYSLEDGHELRSVVLDYEANPWSVAVLDLDKTLALHEINLHVRTAWEKLIARGVELDSALDDEQLQDAYDLVREAETRGERAVAARLNDAGEIVVEVED